MTRTLSIAFLAFDWLLKKVNKISLVKTLTVRQLKVELEILHKLTFYLSVFLLMIKLSQWTSEKFCSYCKIDSLYVSVRLPMCFINREIVGWSYFVRDSWLFQSSWWSGERNLPGNDISSVTGMLMQFFCKFCVRRQFKRLGLLRKKTFALKESASRNLLYLLFLCLFLSCSDVKRLLSFYFRRKQSTHLYCTRFEDGRT